MQRMYVDQCRLKLQDCAVPKLAEKRDCFMIYEWLHWKKWRKKNETTRVTKHLSLII